MPLGLLVAARPMPRQSGHSPRARPPFAKHRSGASAIGSAGGKRHSAMRFSRIAKNLTACTRPPYFIRSRWLSRSWPRRRRRGAFLLRGASMAPTISQPFAPALTLRRGLGSAQRARSAFSGLQYTGCSAPRRRCAKRAGCLRLHLPTRSAMRSLLPAERCRPTAKARRRLPFKLPMPRAAHLMRLIWRAQVCLVRLARLMVRTACWRCLKPAMTLSD